MKLNFLLWTGQHYTRIAHDYSVDAIEIKDGLVEIKARSLEVQPKLDPAHDRRTNSDSK